MINILRNFVLAVTLATAPIAAAMREPVRAASTERSTFAGRDAENLINDLMSTIQRSKKPLPVWAIDTALLAYKTYRTYKNGEKVEEIGKEVVATLRLVAEVKEMVEQGRDMSEREYRLTRELVDARTRRLNDLAARVSKIEKRFYRPACGIGNAWRQGRCVNVADNPRAR